MKYAELRPIIKSGDVLAWSGGDWKSLRGIQLNLVRIFTRSEYDHVGLAWVVAGRVFVVEAVVPEVRIFPLSKLMPFFYLRTPSTWWSDHAEDALMARVGLPYSKWEAIKAFFSKNTDGESTWECAKLVNRTLMEFDPSMDGLHDTPTAVVKYLETEGAPLLYIGA